MWQDNPDQLNPFGKSKTWNSKESESPKVKVSKPKTMTTTMTTTMPTTTETTAMESEKTTEAEEMTTENSYEENG